jgi:glycosyltransferase involved in cell wall biosynthesis
MPAIRIAHLTPHRDPFEPRTFFECLSLAEAGYDVVLVAPHDGDLVRDGVRLLGVPPYRSRLERVTTTAWRTVRRGWAARPALVHIHDPELIPWGLLMRLAGRPVVYTVHEDYAQAAGVRTWIPGPARRLLAGFYGLIAALARRAFVIVIAERYYARSFPGAVEVLNYARLEEFAGLADIVRGRPDRPRALYTGSITASRGGRHHARLAAALPPEARVTLVGVCAEPDLAAELRGQAAADPRLDLRMADRWVPREQIVAAYREPWTCGLALFPDTPHYREKELTKFFEYMAAGLPIVASAFPVWRALVEGERVGICVDPEDPAAAAAAIRWLQDHPAEAAAMGERGRRAVAERYNWGSQAARLVELYRGLLGGNGPGGTRDHDLKPGADGPLGARSEAVRQL